MKIDTTRIVTFFVLVMGLISLTTAVCAEEAFYNAAYDTAVGTIAAEETLASYQEYDASGDVDEGVPADTVYAHVVLDDPEPISACDATSENLDSLWVAETDDIVSLALFIPQLEFNPEQAEIDPELAADLVQDWEGAWQDFEAETGRLKGGDMMLDAYSLQDNPFFGCTLQVDSVTDAIDDNIGDGLCADQVGRCTLRAAIMEANELNQHCTIHVPAGTYFLAQVPKYKDFDSNKIKDPNEQAAGDLNIYSSMKIIGVGKDKTFIDGNHLYRVFNVSTSGPILRGDLKQDGSCCEPGAYFDSNRVKLTLSQLTIQHGGLGAHTGKYTTYKDQKGNTYFYKDVQWGCGIATSSFAGRVLLNAVNVQNNCEQKEAFGCGLYNTMDVNVDLMNSAVRDNHCSYGGGAGIRNEGGTLTLTASTVTGNTSTQADGGAGIYSYSGEVTLKDSTVTNNKVTDNARGSRGGGLTMVGGGGQVKILNSTVTNNKSDFGGGMWVSGGKTEIKGSIISSNQACNGGGIANGGEIDLIASQVSKNLADNVDPQLDTGCAQITCGEGAGISNYGIVRSVDSSIQDNIAKGEGGGVANGTDDFPVKDAKLRLERTTVSGNKSGAVGGGVSNYSAILTLVNSTVSSNTATGSGGGIYSTSAQNQSSTIEFFSTTIAGNTTTNLLGGGGVFLSYDMASLQSTLIAGNFDLSKSGKEEPDCAISPKTAAKYDSLGYNLVGTTNNAACLLQDVGDKVGNKLKPISAKLGMLVNNGGPTATHALLLGSPAIDQGTPKGCVDEQGNLLATDQRWIARPQGNDCDIGAFELGGN